MNTDDKILIERKLRQGLSPEEQEIFLLKIEKDEDFKEDYEFEKQLFDNLGQSDWNFVDNTNADEVQEYTELFKAEKTAELAKIIAENSTEFHNRKKSRQRSRRIFLLSGIAAAILIVFISIFALFYTTKSTEDLYNSYLDTSELLSLIPRGGDIDDSITNAQDLFENEKYEDALAIFNELLNNNLENRATILIYKGIAEMETGKNDSALATFDLLIDSEYIDSPRGYWYKALLYLKTGQKEKAKSLLEKIKSESLFNYNKAGLILEEL